MLRKCAELEEELGEQGVIYTSTVKASTSLCAHLLLIKEALLPKHELKNTMKTGKEGTFHVKSHENLVSTPSHMSVTYQTE